MTQRATCTGTTALDYRDGIINSIERGVYPACYGRRVCATCGGNVIPNADGKLRSHKVGSNVTKIQARRPLSVTMREAGIDVDALGIAHLV